MALGRSKRELAAARPRARCGWSVPYALLHRDEAELRAVSWSRVILDEAQNMKNPSTRAAQAARKLPARWRAGSTGTPVENRLVAVGASSSSSIPATWSAEFVRKRFWADRAAQRSSRRDAA